MEREARRNVELMGLTDITEFQIPAGKVYLSPVIDCFDGLVISWSIGTHSDAELVNTMLDAAVETVVDTNDRPVVHSDRGPTIAAQAGCRVSEKRCSSARCPAKGARLTTRRAKASRLKTELFDLGTGRPRPLSSLSR